VLAQVRGSSYQKTEEQNFNSFPEKKSCCGTPVADLGEGPGEPGPPLFWVKKMK